MCDIELRPMHENDLEVASELALRANSHAEKETYKKHILDELRENPDLAVAKEFQKNGVRSKLLSIELEALKKKGSKIVIAEGHWRNAEAIQFYYKHGFRLSGCAQDFFGVGHDTIILKRIL